VVDIVLKIGTIPQKVDSISCYLVGTALPLGRGVADYPQPEA
jgi:hypothetical protein